MGQHIENKSPQRISIQERSILLTLALIARLPLSINRAIGYVLGWLWATCPTRERHISRCNIAHCYPELSAKEQQRRVRQSLIHSAMTLVEMPYLWQQPWDKVASKVLAVEGLEHLDALIEQDKGGIIIGPHIGNWEIAGLFASERAGGAMSLYRPPKLPHLDALIQRGRGRTGNQILPASVRGVAGVMRHLKQGGLTCILPDQLPDKQSGGIYAPFMGHPALTMTLIHSLIQKTGCSAIYATAKRVSGGFHIIFDPATLELTNNNAIESVTALNQGVDACIRRCPDQYQWAYKRFRRQKDRRSIYKAD